MSVLKKNRRTINVEDVQYVWYICPDEYKLKMDEFVLE